MQAFLVFLASLPSWAAMAIVGAIGGAIGGLLGVGMERIGWKGAARVLSPVAIGLSIVLSNQVIMPAAKTARLNDGLPQRLDESTVLQSAHFTSAGIAYQYELEGEIPAAFNVQMIKNENLSIICQYWRPTLISSPATLIDYEYKWASGEGAFTISASDCL